MRCTSCRGSKKVMGMGAVFVKCQVCDGVGTVVDSEKVKEAVKVSSGDSDSVAVEVKTDDKVDEVKTERPAVKRKYKRKSVG